MKMCEAYQNLFTLEPFRDPKDLDGEIWRDVEGYDGYQVSNLGNVKSFKHCNKGRLLKPSLRNGYSFVQFGQHGKCVNIHRLVAETFIPNLLNKPCVNHINGIKSDNRVENLEWCTPSENNLHATQTGLSKSGGDNYQAALTNEQAKWCREVYVAGHPEFGCNALARRFNVNVENMRKILHGKSYKNAGGIIHAPAQYKGHKRIPQAVRAEIRRLYIKGDKDFGARPLARQFGIARETIKQIVEE